MTSPDLLLIDNYDSFVHNLARYFRLLGRTTLVVRNDAIDVAQIEALRPRAVVISPGPCTPNEAGVSLEAVRSLPDRLPLLGVCLGHQAIAQALGGRILRAPEPMHGRTSEVWHDGTGLFQTLPQPMRACRYHSLVVDSRHLPEQLRVTARTSDGVVMAVEHRQRPLWGVQFHPEAILTQGGFRLLANFLRLAGFAEPITVPADEWAAAEAAAYAPPVRPVTF